VDVEARMGTEMTRKSPWLAPLVVGGAWLLWGWEGAAAAIVGVLLAVGSLWITGRLLSWSARRSPSALAAAAMGGFVVRLVVLTTAVWVGLEVFDLDSKGLVLGIGVTYLGLLVLQARKELLRG